MSDLAVSRVGANIRRLRMDAGKTIDQLSAASGVSARTIISLEQVRDANPRLSIVEALAGALGVDTADLLAAS